MNPRKIAALTILLPSLAAAQGQPGEASPAPVRDPAEAIVLDGEGGQAAGSEPGTYLIQKGDTLWDLSARFYADPWAWPKLWSYNPQIENPHWIYPGNPLRVGPGGVQPPARVEAGDAAPSREVGDLTRGEIDRVQMLDDEDAVTVGGAYRVGAARGKGPPVLRNSFVTANELEGSGTVVAAAEEKMYLTTGDRIYGRFKDPASIQVGQRYSLYRTEGKIRHPVEHTEVGYKTVILGTARVTAVDPGKAVTLVITYVNDTVERGDLIGPSVEQAQRPLFIRPNHRSVDGYVIAVQPAIATGAAEYNVVYLDKGRTDGVEVGNTFEVVRSGDPLNEPPDRPLESRTLPREVIGHLVVFDAQDGASTAYVRRSLAEILVGDHVEMRPAAAQSPARQGG